MSANPQAGTSFDLFDRPTGSILHAAQEAIVMVDERQRIVAINPAAERMFRCKAPQVLGQPLERFIPPRQRAAHAVQVDEFATSASLQQRLVRHRHTTAARLDGSEFPVEISLSRVDMAEGDSVRHYFAALVLDHQGHVPIRDTADPPRPSGRVALRRRTAR